MSSCGIRKTNSCIFDLPKRTSDIKSYESEYFDNEVTELKLVTDLFCNKNDTIYDMQDQSRVVHFIRNEGKIDQPYLIYYRPDYCKYLYAQEEQSQVDITQADCRIEVVGMMFGYSIKELERNGWNDKVSLESAQDFFNEISGRFVREFKPQYTSNEMNELFLDYMNYPKCDDFFFTVLQKRFYRLTIETESNVTTKSFQSALIEAKDGFGNSSYTVVIRQRMISMYE